MREKVTEDGSIEEDQKENEETRQETLEKKEGTESVIIMKLRIQLIGIEE